MRQIVAVNSLPDRRAIRVDQSLNPRNDQVCGEHEMGIATIAAADGDLFTR
jgi:hypothetical protein